MFIGDLYQRQPLLPQNTKSEKWNHGNHSPAVEFYDEEEEDDIQKTDERNGHIRIDLPPPIRDEPRFPQEKCKTLLGELIYFSTYKIIQFIIEYMKSTLQYIG